MNRTAAAVPPNAPPAPSPEQIAAALHPIRVRADRVIRWCLVAHLVFAMLLAPVHDTWAIALLLGGAATAGFWALSALRPGGVLTRCLAGVALQTFCGLHIYQMHGLAEMHFFFFTSTSIMVLYKDWIAIWPGVLGIVVQHVLFAWMHNAGMPVEFFEKSHVGPLQLGLHFGTALLQAGIVSYVAATARQRRVTELQQRMQLERQQKELEVVVAWQREAERDRRQVTSKLEALVEHAPLAIITIGPDGRVQSWNPAAEQLFGWRAEEVLEQPLPITPPGGRQHTRALWQEVFEGGTIVGREVERLRKDGTMVPVAVSASRLADEQGGHRALFIYADLTPRRAAEREIHRYVGEVQAARAMAEQRAAQMEELNRELEAARNDALEAVRLKAQFLANMSHEIRTPMNAIVGFSDLMLEMPLGEVERDFAQTISSAAHNLLAIINDILDYSKLEAGQFVLEQEPFSLATVAEEVAELLALRAQGKGVELMLRVDPALPPRLVGDGGRVRQVLLNLVGNAVKFTEHGSVLLDVAVQEASASLATVRVTVADTGIGIPADKLATIFDKFSQVDGSHSRRFGGTGLGLAIARELVQLMGGDIRVSSTVGEGSRFELTVTWTVAEPAPAPLVIAPGARAPRVLVVDDYPQHARILVEQLEALGVVAEPAFSGAEALERLHGALGEGRPFALCVVDLQMPVLDGEAVARAVREEPALEGLAVVALTAQDRRGEAAYFLGKGFDALLVKPVRSGELRRLVELAAARAAVMDVADATLPGAAPRR